MIRPISDEEDETELPDQTTLAAENLFVAGETANNGANHPDDELPDDAAIQYQDPNARLDEGLG
jgi:hypothetical protein